MVTVADPVSEMERARRVATVLNDARSRDLLTSYVMDLEYEIARRRYLQVRKLLS